MKQVIQSLRETEPTVQDVPTPSVRTGGVLVRTAASMVSAGTERMVVDFAEKNLLQKARSRPDLVRQTWDKAKREGILTTFEAVQNRLDQAMPLGYSSAGVVVEVGDGVTEMKVGDRVACAGGGYAVHAEMAVVPKNLVVALPDNVDFDAGAFTTLGAIALQGVRLSEAKLGEIVAVIGLGLLGQLSVQLLRAAGCIVIGMDIQPERSRRAQQLGASVAVTSAEELESAVAQLTDGHGVDAVLITADTKSNQPVEVAGEIARTKGIVVAVGAVGMNIPRKTYYEKELDFRISRSYGPGRYDPNYEERGNDYPYAYVRWTEQRNMQAFVQMLSAGNIDVAQLVTHRFPIQDALRAYDLIGGKTNEPFLGVLLTYPDVPNLSRKVALPGKVIPEPGPSTGRALPVAAAQVRLGVLGAGNFANATLLPALKGMQGITLSGLASGSVNARTTGDRFGFSYCTTDESEVLHDPDVNTIAVLTRHHLHARQVIAALQAGKHAFVEKPLCLTDEELESIIAVYNAAIENAHEQGKPAPALVVGFNRRFAPWTVELKKHLERVQEPLMLHYRVNGGYIPPDHWIQDPVQGGGRVRGEVCHFIDLLLHLAGSAVRNISTLALPDSGRYMQDNVHVRLEFDDGSLGTITYTANGAKSFGKESLEVFGGGLSARLEDFRVLTIHQGTTRINRTARLRQDKGHRAEWAALVAYLTGKGRVPMAFDDIVRSTRATLAAYKSLQTGTTATMPEDS